MRRWHGLLRHDLFERLRIPTGDGTCDDGTYGYDLTCAEFSYDDF